MRTTMRRRVMVLGAGASLMFLAARSAVAQDKKPAATLALSEGRVAVGVGYSWGSGTLTYKGKKYPVQVEGLSVGEVGVSKATAHGEVFDLKKVEDFSGTYTAGEAGATMGGGAGVTAMKNQNGVVIHLK